MHVGQAIVATLVLVGEAFVIDAELMHDCGLKVVYVYRIFNDVDTVVIGFSVCETGLDSASGQPIGKTVGMVVSPIIFRGEFKVGEELVVFRWSPRALEIRRFVGHENSAPEFVLLPGMRVHPRGYLFRRRPALRRFPHRLKSAHLAISICRTCRFEICRGDRRSYKESRS